MDFFLVLLIAFPICGYYLFVGIFDLLFNSKKEDTDVLKPDNITNIHYHTHNHLHVDKKDLTEMIGNKKSNT